MKIVRYSHNGQRPRLGCFLGDDRVADLEASCEAYLSNKAVVRAHGIAAALFPHESTRAFLEGGVATQDMLGAMVEAARAGEFQPVSHPLSAVRRDAPISDPGEVLCTGRHYTDPAAGAIGAIRQDPPRLP